MEITLRITEDDGGIDAARRMLDAQLLCSAINDLSERLRQVYKYGQDPVAARHAERWREELHRVLEEHGVSEAVYG